MIFRIILFLILTAVPAVVSANEGPSCKNTDEACRKFLKLTESEAYDQIVKEADAPTRYSEEARSYIANAYLRLASREENTPEQEEAYCRKALEYGAVQAYMGLYFIYARKDPGTALGFLRQYIATKPADSVPYVILGEAELEGGSYRDADIHLREAKRLARAYSARVDWLLFQANYLLKNYADASELLGSALRNGKFEEELKDLLSDKRFSEIEKLPEFRKYRGAFKGARARS